MSQQSRLRTENNDEGHKRHLVKRRVYERRFYGKQRDELHDNYITKRLIDQGLRRDEITERQIVEKRKKLSLKRSLRPQRKTVRLKQKELILARAKEKQAYAEHLEENELKRCCRCKELKSFNQFYPCRIKNTSYSALCKLCERIINKQKRKGTSTGIKAYG